MFPIQIHYTAEVNMFVYLLYSTYTKFRSSRPGCLDPPKYPDLGISI